MPGGGGAATGESSRCLCRPLRKTTPPTLDGTPAVRFWYDTYEKVIAFRRWDCNCCRPCHVETYTNICALKSAPGNQTKVGTTRPSQGCFRFLSPINMLLITKRATRKQTTYTYTQLSSHGERLPLTHLPRFDTPPEPSSRKENTQSEQVNPEESHKTGKIKPNQKRLPRVVGSNGLPPAPIRLPPSPSIQYGTAGRPLRCTFATKAQATTDQVS